MMCENLINLKTLYSNDPLTYQTLKTQNHTTIKKMYIHFWLESLPDNVVSWKEYTFGRLVDLSVQILPNRQQCVVRRGL